MLYRYAFLLFTGLLHTSYAQVDDLSRFFNSDVELSNKVDSIYDQLTDAERIGQLIMPAVGRHGKPRGKIEQLAKNKQLGGILLLNGERNEFKSWVERFDSIGQDSGGLPFLYSADAEPSLIRYKIKNCKPVPNADKHRSTDEVKNTALSISRDLNFIGINYNFAPVIDQGNENSAITNRSFGHNKDSIWAWSNTFIEASQKMGVIATAKHFPGHGLVVGDTHDELVFIDGILMEVDNYKPVIQGGVLSIMVGHIAVKNNPKYGTFGMPATCSKKIVTDLLKNELGFKGLVVTDAMNMGGVRDIPNSGVKAIEAGCDILLMPVDEVKEITAIQDRLLLDDAFRSRVENAVKKIIRVKICLGLL